MPQLIIDLTQDQYDRFKAAYRAIQNMETDPTDEQLIAQLKREASAVTYASEVGNGDGSEWIF